MTKAAPIEEHAGLQRQHLTAAELEAMAHRLTGQGARLADLFVSLTDSETLVLHLVWDTGDAYLLTESDAK